VPNPKVEKVFELPKTIRPDKNHYCSGCGHGIAHRLIAELVEEMGLQDRTVAVCPVGCAVTAYDYWNVDSSEAAHGRAPAVANGIKLVRPDNLVLTYQGDGDLASIGMAETIHTANRGVPITIVFINNANYGMTGGQLAPTTLPGQKTTTTPAGRNPLTEGYPIDMCALLSTLKAPKFIAREMLTSPGKINKAKKLLRRAFEVQMDHNGFSFIEFLGACPTNWHLTPVDSLDFIKNEMTTYFETRIYRDIEE
jgi:2-oxoglutarate ferredoxin oxidoreductase subunit beta